MCKPPPCLCAPFFPLPLYRQTGKQTIILWTHYSAWSSYHNQPSRVSNLGSAKLCSVYTMWLFVSVLLGFFFSFFFSRRRCEGGKSKEKETDRARERGWEREIVCTHLHTCLWGYSTNLKIRQVCGRVSILGTQWTTHKGFVSSYLLPIPFHGTAHSLHSGPCPANITIPHGRRHTLFSKLHCVWGGCVLGQLKTIRMSPHQQCLCAVAYHWREYITLAHCYMAAYQTLQVKQ